MSVLVAFGARISGCHTRANAMGRVGAGWSEFDQRAFGVEVVAA